MLDVSRYSLPVKVLSLKMTGQVGPRTFGLLMTHFETVDNILLAEDEELLGINGIGPERSHAVGKAGDNLDRAQVIIDNLEASDTRVICCLDEAYPQILQELNDPPLLLYYQGQLPADNEKRVAVIGSQDVSAEGIAEGVEIARRLAGQGISIIGGLARGIDTAGHMGALKANGKTYAILPSGFNQIYPPENQVLSSEIIKTGGLISEYLPDTPVQSGRLISRNRLIVGLSQAVVVGEVSAESVGTLDAALCCQQLGKLLFVMVGLHNHHLDKLIAYGAVPITRLDDIRMIMDVLV